MFNYSRPASWKGFQDSEVGMIAASGALCFPLLSAALGRKVDYTDMEKNPSIFLFTSS